MRAQDRLDIRNDLIILVSNCSVQGFVVSKISIRTLRGCHLLNFRDRVNVVQLVTKFEFTILAECKYLYHVVRGGL